MYRGTGSQATRRHDGLPKRRPHEEEEEIIRVPAFDNSDLIEKFKRTLIGRMFHSDGRSVEALLKHMPKRRIWDVEGRVRGSNLGNNKFLFDFDKEEDLEKVLQKRPCHFNRWSFALEKWTPTIKEEFPNAIPFWANVIGVPIHYRKQETFESVGKALGTFVKADVEGSKVRVLVDGDRPLKFECKVGFDNGDVVKVTIQYEDLYRYCFSCKRLSHEEGTCPDLNDEQREGNRLSRIAQHDLEERATREAFSLPQRPRAGTEKESHDTRSKGQELRRAEANPTEFRRGNHHEGTDKNSQDLRRRLLEKRDTMSKNVWNRLDHVKDTQHEPLQNRVRYHPYNRQTGAYSRDTQRETVSSSEWRPKDVGRNTYGREADKWYERQSDKHWERSRTTTSRNRRSPDSQRTVSDYRKNDAKAYYRGRNSRSPPSNRMEWRPVDRARETGTSRGLLKRSNAPEETKSSGGIAPEREGARRSLIESPQADMEVEKSPRQDAENRGTKGGAENETSMTPTEKEGPILDKGQGSNEQSGKTQEETPQQRKDREDRELEQSISEYAELADQAMTQEMIDNDDLLEEHDEQLDFIPETEHPIREEEMVDEQIEALSQMSPEPQINTQKAGPKMISKKESRAEEAREITQNIKKSLPNQSISAQTAPEGSRKGVRGQELKGAAASKKLANRGRLSPKSKQLKPPRDQLIQSRNVPRHEVYPSSRKSRRSLATTGSMVSQKPSSSQI